MKNSKYIRNIIGFTICCLFASCEDFVEIDAPEHKISSEIVFANDETALSAMKGIYNQLAAVPFSSGGPDSVTVLAGLSADGLTPIRATNMPYMEFEQHEVSPDNLRNYNLWRSAYNVIYLANSLLEGLVNSENISEDVRSRLEGEARFVRSFSYFYLVNLYGEVPLILTTDFQENSLAERNAETEVYEQILTDLGIAIELLEGKSDDINRLEVDQYAAIALLARVQLFLRNWEEAEKLSSRVISQSATYEILEDLNQVFLANSKEAIWQLSPIGRGTSQTNTNEGAVFIIHPIFSFLAQIKLASVFVEGFEDEDKRVNNWIGFHPATENFFSNKYKIQNSVEEVTEYSMVLRLAEQYLIRAEARARMGNLTGSIADLDVIRARAGLELISHLNPAVSKEELILLILEERKKEFFAEWGHRWFDLKRTGLAKDVLGSGDPLWQDFDVLYPIPQAERMVNPNLSQNEGY